MHVWPNVFLSLTAAVAHSLGFLKAQSLPHSVLVTWVVGAMPSRIGMEMFGRRPGLVTQGAPTADVRARAQAYSKAIRQQSTLRMMECQEHCERQRIG
jgi:hypothetical protein